MNIDIYAFSGNGAKLCDKIIEGLNEHSIEAFVPKRYVYSARYVEVRQDNLYNSTNKSFKEKNCIIFIGAVGIAVRAIAPFIKSKKTDPAIICIDEKGQNVISLLSGHIGGANQLSIKIADIVGGNSIITTATDINGKFAVDEWASNKNMHLYSLKAARDIAADILENKKIGLASDFHITGKFPPEIDVNQNKIGICLSLDSKKKPFDTTLNVIPKIVSVGVGCRKDTNFKNIYYAIKDVLKENNISHWAIKSLNSIDLKKDEEAIIKTARIFKVPFFTYSKDELNKINGQFSKSNFVNSITGVDTVCERAAIIGSNSHKLIINKTVKKSITVAVAIDNFDIDFKYK